MFSHGSFGLTGLSGIFFSASLYAFSSFFFCCCSVAVCSSLFWPSLPPPLPFPIWACAGTASPAIIAAIMKVLISVVPYGQETHGRLTFKLWQIRHLECTTGPPEFETGRVQGRAPAGNIVEGVYAAFRQPKIRRVRCWHARIGHA